MLRSHIPGITVVSDASNVHHMILAITYASTLARAGVPLTSWLVELKYTLLA